MKNKSFLSVILGLVSAISVSFAAPPESIDLVTSKPHYQHGFNATNPSTGGKDTPREDRDSVMIASTMHYFVMPDANFNKAYAVAGDWTDTDATKSEFEWTLTPASGTVTPVTPNTTGTSPHVEVAWTDVGDVELKLVEKPKEYMGVALQPSTVCPSDEVIIPVTVIHQPSVKFGQVSGSYSNSDCVDNLTNAKIVLPLIPATTSGNFGANISDAYGVVISYTIARNDAAATAATATFANLQTASHNWEIPVTDYGKYVVTITAITDRIAVKCGVATTSDSHIGTVAERTFTYLVMPQPEPGPSYHIPNYY
ncbi:MAG: hypothetical protein LBS03_09900 [Bacteroidales bacterium]|jgi:hypothetical protein|nr:hypothetical protein [Bacteroidales bacterium]